MHFASFKQSCISVYVRFITARNLILIAPLFVLTVKHWINLVILVITGFSIRYLHQTRSERPKYSGWQWAIFFSLIGPLIAVVIGQLLRQDYYPQNYDAPLHLALGGIIFLAVSSGWLRNESTWNISRVWVQFIFPISLLLIVAMPFTWTKGWDSTGYERITTYFVDPLTFGSLTLLLGLLSISALSFYWKSSNHLHRFIMLIGATLGFYLSAASLSRTGWGNIPVFFCLWFFLFSRHTLGLLKSIAFIFVGLICSALLIYTHPYLLEKIISIFIEIQNYKLYELNPDSSVALRISFYRSGWFYFQNSPLYGWGDLGWMRLMDAPELKLFCSDFCRNFPIHGFHNEIVTSAVRSGIWGLVSSVMFFLVPIAWCINILRQYPFPTAQCTQAFFALVCISHLLIAGMTTEVTNLSFLGSYVGLLLGVLLGESFLLNNQNPGKTNTDQ